MPMNQYSLISFLLVSIIVLTCNFDNTCVQQDNDNNNRTIQQQVRFVQALNTTYQVHTLVGNTVSHDMLRMFNAQHAYLKAPCGIEMGFEDDLVYISDCERHVLFKMFPNESMVVYGGLGKAGYNGDGYHVKQTLFDMPSSVGVALNGDLFVADTNNNRVRIVSASTGLVSSLSETFNKPLGVSVSVNNMVYIADTGNNVIKKFDISTGLVTVLGGLYGKLDGTHDNVNANSIILRSPKNIHVVSNGKLDTVYFTDEERLKSIDSEGKYRIVDGSFPQSNLYGIFVESSTNSIWTTSNTSHFVQMKTIGSSLTSTFIGQQDSFGYEGDNLSDSYTQVRFFNPTSIVVKNSMVYVADQSNNCIRKIDVSNKIVSTFSGGIVNHPFGENILPFETSPINALSITFTYKNELYFLEGSYIIRKLSNGLIKTIFGSISQLKIDNSPTRKYVNSILSLFCFPNGDLVIGTSNTIYFFNIETKLMIGSIQSSSVLSVVGIGDSLTNGSLLYSDRSSNLIYMYKNGNVQSQNMGIIVSYMAIVSNQGNMTLYCVSNNNQLYRSNLEQISILEKVSLPISVFAMSSENSKLYISDQSRFYELNVNNSILNKIGGLNSYNISGTLYNFVGYNGENLPVDQSTLNPSLINPNNGTVYISSSTSYITRVSNGITKTIVGRIPTSENSVRTIYHFTRDSSQNIIYFIDGAVLKKYDEKTALISSLTLGIQSASSPTAATIPNPYPFFFMNPSVYVLGRTHLIFSQFDGFLYLVDVCKIIQIDPKTMSFQKVAGNVCGSIIMDISALNSPIPNGKYFGFSSNPLNGDLFLFDSSKFYKLEKSSGMFRSLVNFTNSVESPDSLVTNQTGFGALTYAHATNQDSFYFCTSSQLRVVEKLENGSYYLKTIVGNGEIGYSGDNLPALKSTASPLSFYVRNNGDIIILESSFIIRKYVKQTGLLKTLTGSPTISSGSFNGDVKGSDIKFTNLLGSTYYSEQNEEVYFMDGSSTIRKLSIVCDGMATYIQSNKSCQCLSGYYGENCQPISCNGTLATSLLVCGGSGVCVDFDVCSCKIGFTGQFCEIDQTVILIISIVIPILAVLIIMVIVTLVIIVSVCFVSIRKNHDKQTNKKEVANAYQVQSNLEMSDFPSGSIIISSSAGSVNSDTENFFSKFSNIERIGQGAFGSVYKVTHKNKVKAIKVVKFESFTDLNTIMKEASQLSHVKHPNVLKVNDYFITNDNLLCIDMDYYESGDLTKFLKIDCSEQILG